MNKGTIIRTIMAIALVINSGAIASGIAEFNDPVVDKWYKIISFGATVVILFVNTYYNNDYTEEASVGTQLTRSLKAEGALKTNISDEGMGAGDPDKEELEGEIYGKN